MAEADTQSVARNPYPFRAATEEERERRRRLSRSMLGSPISARNLQPLRINAAVKLGSRQMDKAEQEVIRARQLRQGRIDSLKGKAKLKAIGQDLALAKVEALTKYYRKFRAILTIIGGLSSLTIIGIIWTIIQWNVQFIWTLFGLPGKDFMGLPWFLVPLILLIDCLVFILFATVMLLAYFFSHPGEAACAVGPALVEEFLGNGFIATVFKTVIGWGC